MNRFTANKLNFDTVDIFYIRKSILEKIEENSNLFHGSFLDIGCGQMPYKELLQPYVTNYIGLDLDNNYSNIKPDLYWDGKSIPLGNETVDSAMATEVIEHVPDIDHFLFEIHRVLKPGGILFFTVPFLWPLHDVPYDEFRYTPFSLRRLFEKNGYEVVKINSMGGWNASMAQMLGLWIKRSSIPNLARKLLYLLLYPFYKILISTDKPNSSFPESSMITGLSGIIKKKAK